jgi:hypothetical protein
MLSTPRQAGAEGNLNESSSFSLSNPNKCIHLHTHVECMLVADKENCCKTVRPPLASGDSERNYLKLLG